MLMIGPIISLYGVEDLCGRRRESPIEEIYRKIWIQRGMIDDLDRIDESLGRVHVLDRLIRILPTLST